MLKPIAKVDVGHFELEFVAAMAQWDRNYDTPPKFILCSPDLYDYCFDRGLVFRTGGKHFSIDGSKTTHVTLELRSYYPLEDFTFRITNLHAEAPIYTVELVDAHLEPSYPTKAHEIAALLYKEP